MVKHGKLSASWVSYSPNYNSSDPVVLKTSNIWDDDTQTGSNNSGPFNIQWKAICHNKLNPFSSDTDRIHYEVDVRCKCGSASGSWKKGATGFDNLDASTERKECKKCGSVAICWQTFPNSISDVFENTLTIVSAAANPAGFAAATALQLTLEKFLSTLPQSSQDDIRKVKALKDLISQVAAIKSNPLNLKNLPSIIRNAQKLGISV